MANQPEIDQFDSGVYQLEQTDPVLAGLGGVSNKPLLSLANRTKYLYNRIGEILGVSKGYVIASGTANAITATYTPAVTALTDGMTLRFRGAAANTGATTFKAGSTAASPVYGQDHVALTGGEIALNGECEVQWNAALNSANGAWVLIRNSGGLQRVIGFTGAPTAPTPAVGTNTTQLANMAAVQAALANAGISTALTSKGTFDLNTAAIGSLCSVNGTESLAAANNWPTTGSAGTAAVWYNVFTYGTDGGGARITQVATQVFAGANQSRTWVREKHDATWSAWRESAFTDSPVFSGTPTAPTAAVGTNTTQLATMAAVQAALGAVSLQASGYYKFSNGLILQWGASGTLPSQTVVGITFPLAFPNAVAGVWANSTDPGYLSSASYRVNVSGITKTGAGIGCTWATAPSFPALYFAIGY